MAFTGSPEGNLRLDHKIKQVFKSATVNTEDPPNSVDSKNAVSGVVPNFML